MRKSGPQFRADLIYRLPDLLRQAQPAFDRTGGIHAAALFSSEGALIGLREDVGRHNAVDKLIGFALRDGAVALEDSLILVSGRAGFELVQKSAMAAIPILAAVGAPSSLAVEVAQRFGMTLIGFLAASASTSILAIRGLNETSHSRGFSAITTEPFGCKAISGDGYPHGIDTLRLGYETDLHSGNLFPVDRYGSPVQPGLHPRSAPAQSGSGMGHLRPDFDFSGSRQRGGPSLLIEKDFKCLHDEESNPDPNHIPSKFGRSLA